MTARLVLGLLWLLHFLPYGALARIGEGLGWLAFHLVRPRREVCLINLRKVFPEMPEAERVALARKHFLLLGRFVLDHAISWWGSKARFLAMVRLEDEQYLAKNVGKPVIVLAPHFLGMDLAGVRLACDYTMASIYQKQKNPVVDERIRSGRLRFVREGSRLISRQEGLRGIARAIKERLPLFYLPDLDFGPRDSVFVPFFGVQAATITGVSRLAKLTGARIVPCVTRMTDDGYVARLYPAWDDFPTDDPVADARRMNAFIEERVRERPEQYYWVHKRFKTRPQGEKKFY